MPFPHAFLGNWKKFSCHQTMGVYLKAIEKISIAI
jgi:hypothetical protein